MLIKVKKTMNKHKNEEYNLTVSDFAKICGTTRDTLRHYYEKGILVPYVNEENGYHYYASSQIASFYFITIFKNVGCSLNDINILINSPSKEEVSNAISNRINNIEEQMHKLQQNYNALNIIKHLFDLINSAASEDIFINEHIPMSYFKTAIRDNENAINISAIIPETVNHINYYSKNMRLSPFPIGSSISYDDLIAEKYIYNNIISFSMEKADGKTFFEVPGSKCVCCYHTNNNGDIKKSYRKITKFIEKNHLTPCSDLFIISLVNLYDNSEKHTYCKFMMICVE